MDELIGRIERAVAALAAQRRRVEAGEPWPLSDRFGTEPEASWGPRETLAHVTEMLPYWLGELERILAGPAWPVPFGRVASNELRIGIIERDRSLPLRELYARIDAGSSRLTSRLRELSTTEAARTGQHSARGLVTVEEAVARFLAGHLEEHVTQMDEILARSRG